MIVKRLADLGGGRLSRLRRPRIYRLKIGDLFEIADVARDEFEVVGNGNGGDLRILDADRAAKLGSG